MLLFTASRELAFGIDAVTTVQSCSRVYIHSAGPNPTRYGGNRLPWRRYVVWQAGKLTPQLPLLSSIANPQIGTSNSVGNIQDACLLRHGW